MFHIYINSVVNKHQQIEKAADRFFSQQKSPPILMLNALKHPDAKLFFKHLTEDGNKETLQTIFRFTRWEIVDKKLFTNGDNSLEILEILSKCEYFPSMIYLDKFLQDLQKEINDGADGSPTNKAIQILTKAQAGPLATRIINEQESLGSASSRDVFPPSTQSVSSAVYKGPPLSNPTREGEENDNSTNKLLNQKQLLDQVAPKPHEVKQELPEASIVLEEVISDNVIEEWVEKVRLIPQSSFWSDLQQPGLLRLETSRASEYQLLNKPFLGDIASRVDEEALLTYEALSEEVD